MSDSPAVRLLLVEAEGVASRIEEQLRDYGYRVEAVVASGEQAVEQVEHLRPDLVLMDIQLAGPMDGIDAAIAIRERYRIPVVFLAAYAEDDTLRRALDSRPFGYLIKPCQGRELHATIQMALARREDEAAIEQSEERLKLALDAASLGVLEWRPVAGRLTGDSFLGMLFGNRPVPFDEDWAAFIERIDPDDRERVSTALRGRMVDNEAICVEFQTLSGQGPPRYMEAYAKSYGDGEAARRVVGIVRDITRRHRDEEQLRQSSAVFQTTAEAIVITDAGRRVIAVNKAFSRITGFAEDEAIGQDPDRLLRVNPGLERYVLFLELDTAGFWHGEVRCHRKDGSDFPAWQSVSVVRDGKGAVSHFVTAFSDVTAIFDAQRQLNYLAHHDPLTGLPNRLLFDDRLENAMEQALRNEQRCLLLFLDLDGFKVINDTLGHAVGDELLRVVGDRLKGILRASDTVARLGGDEFVILTGSMNSDYAPQLAKKILGLLSQPIPVAGELLSVTGSLGIAVFPDNGTDGQQLMRAADMAMYTAKAEGRNRYHFYAHDMSERAHERMSIEQGLRRAIASGNLDVHYQPRVDLADNSIVGVEALVRWRHPERGLLLPTGFIAVAEDCGVIEALGRGVLQRACREMLEPVRAAQARGTDFHVAVNVSARQFLGADFVAEVKATLDETGFPATALELEITESMLQRAEHSLKIINGLTALGVAVSIDDFGTGYSSLSMLNALPINRVKIDRSFIVDLPGSSNQRAMVEAIVTLSRAMHMLITAEGIERPEQASALQALGCQEGQGFLFGKAMPLAELSDRLT
ncbi:EAL domain-containing protein [Dechloromonas hankyongensis]|nr:EAL domain-containing protein [Dechloromonas hankyongensis]